MPSRTARVLKEMLSVRNELTRKKLRQVMNDELPERNSPLQASLEDVYFVPKEVTEMSEAADYHKSCVVLRSLLSSTTLRRYLLPVVARCWVAGLMRNRCPMFNLASIRVFPCRIRTDDYEIATVFLTAHAWKDMLDQRRSFDLMLIDERHCLTYSQLHRSHLLSTS